MSGITISQLPVLSTVTATDSKILLLATDEDTTNTSVALPLSVIYSSFLGNASNTSETIYGNFIVTGNTNVGGTLYSNVISTQTGSGQNLIIDPDGVADVIFTPFTEVFVQSNAAAISTSTGALVVTGGVGVSGNVFANTITTVGTLTSNNHFNQYTIYTNALQANTSVNTSLLTATTINVASINTTSTVNVGGPILFGSGSINAAGASNTTATLVVYDNTYVSGGTGGVVLPPAVVGREISITNSTASTIIVYPNSGASIELLSANQGVSLPPYATLAVVAKTTTNWWATTYIFTAGSDISLTQSGSGSITINSVSTLNSVLGRGNTSTNTINIGGLQSNNIILLGGTLSTNTSAPTIASSTNIAPTRMITFISGTSAIANITPPAPISTGGGQLTLIPTGIFTTTTTGNIGLASTAVVSKALIMTWDVGTGKWYPSY